MSDETRGPACPECQKPLQTVPVANQLAACSQCGERIVADDRYREAFALATANEAWIEKIFWMQTSDGFVPLLLAVFIAFPFAILKWAGWLPALALVGLGGYWWFAPIVYVAVLVAFWQLKKGAGRLLRDHLATAANVIVSSRGLIIVAGQRKPFLLPWSSIVAYSWTSHIHAASLIHLDYRTADSQVARVTVEGEERVQPLGELVDILNARCAPTCERRVQVLG